MFFSNYSRAFTGAFDFNTSNFLFTSLYLEEEPYFSLRIEDNSSFVSVSSLSIERIFLATSIIFSKVYLFEDGAVSEVNEFFISIRKERSILDKSKAKGEFPSLAI